ncbi:MAG: argininosuccinate synthase [Chloroflexota bacterium]|nr:argininosuccinate synthase [Chloroflexota bacterium]
MPSDIKKIVLAYSGGLDTSVILTWLKNEYKAEIICFTADLGQEEELDGLEEKALKTGASKLYIRDLRQEFLTDFILPTIQAGAVYERDYLLGTSFARPLIAKHMVEIAELEGADAVAHGATGKGNDQVRFEVTTMALNPKLKIIAPWREWTLKGREDLLAYAEEFNVPVTATLRSIYSRDRNLFHMSHEAGPLENPWTEPPADMYTLTTAPEQAPDTPQYIELEYERGVPVALDGARMQPLDLFMQLNTIGAAHGVGRIDMVENRLVGMKSRGVYETPGGTILRRAQVALESICLDKQTLQYKDVLAVKYAELVYNGLWYTRIKRALDAFVAVTQENVTGTVRLKLYKGSVSIVGRKSPYSLYREDYASFGEENVYNQKDAEGFIKLFGLPVKIERLMQQQADAGQGVDYSKVKRD